MATTMTSSSAAAVGTADKSVSKSVTRLLQHSILQLCNEHIGYNHKLQILGVLCMTVDDEQQELVVKVNNTLKRVNPINAAKDVVSGQMSPLIESGQPLPQPPMTQSMMQSTTTMITPPESVVHTAKPSQIKTDVPGPSRRSHGRKGTNPIKVHHVYDEGGLMSDEDDILTVIPTDPEASISTSMLTPITTSQQLAVSTINSLSPGGGSVEQFLMHDGEERPAQGSAKRKATYQLRVPQVLTYNDMARSIDCIGATSVRALLMKPLRASPYSGDEDSMSTAAAVQDLSCHHSPLQSENGEVTPRKGLCLPLCISAIDDESHGGDATNNENGPNNQSASSEIDGFKMAVDGVIDFSNKGKSADSVMAMSSPMQDCSSHSSITPQANRQFVALDEDGLLQVKEEPKDDFSYDSSLGGPLDARDSPMTSTPTHPLSLSNPYIGGVSGFVQHMLNSRLPTPSFTSGFSAAGAMASISAGQSNEGLSIRYTSNGPVTVGANGKEVGKMTSRVKDIILYNDQSPLHLQKGNRIEADYMVDKLGMEGRATAPCPDESLTAEEIAEYMGQPGGAGGTVGTGAGTSGTVSENMLFKCQFCLEEVRDLTRYLQHTLTVHNAYICHQCGKSFTTKSSLLRHRPIHTGMRRFACSICKKTFYRKDKCKAHIKRHLGLAADSQNVSHYQKIEPLA